MDSIEAEIAQAAPTAPLPEWQPAVVGEQPCPDAATPHSAADPGMTSAEPPQAGAAQSASMQQPWSTSSEGPHAGSAEVASMHLPCRPSPVSNEQLPDVAEELDSAAKRKATSAEGPRASPAKFTSTQQPFKPSAAHNEQSQTAGEQLHGAADMKAPSAVSLQVSAAEPTSMQQPSEPGQILDDASGEGPAQAEKAAAAAHGPHGSGQGEAASKQGHAWRPESSAAARASKAAEDRESGEIMSNRSRHAEYDSLSEDATSIGWAAASPGESVASSLQNVTAISHFVILWLFTAIEIGHNTNAQELLLCSSTLGVLQCCSCRHNLA